MDAGSEGGGVGEGETRGEEGGLEEEADQLLDGLVVGISLELLVELDNDGVLGVDLHGLAGRHVGLHGGVTEGLSLHDALHVGGPAELAGNQASGGVDDAVTNDDLLDLVTEDLLHLLAQA